MMNLKYPDAHMILGPKHQRSKLQGYKMLIVLYEYVTVKRTSEQSNTFTPTHVAGSTAVLDSLLSCDAANTKSHTAQEETAKISRCLSAF